MSPLSTRDYYEHRQRSASHRAWRGPESYRAFVDILTRRDACGILLDVGCGDGWASYWAEAAGCSVHGVDIAQAAVERTLDKLDAGTALVADATELPYKCCTFECMLALGSLEHSMDVDVALAEAARVLRPGGIAVIVVPNSQFLLGLWQGTEQALAVREERRSITEWQRAARAAGFEVECVQRELERFHPTSYQSMLSRVWTHAARLLLASIPLYWTYQFVMVCRKPNIGQASR